MQIIQTKQGSAEWHWLRLGLITGTRFSQVVSYRENSLEANLIHERLYGETRKAHYSSPDMERGSRVESVARELYAKETDQVIDQVGFCLRDDWIGCSPDGIIWFVGLLLIHGVLEIKCPTEKYHLIWCEGKIKGLYYWQCMGNMWVTGAEWCDFVSYHPNHPLYIQRIHRDEDEIDKLRVASGLLIERVKDKLKGRKMPNVEDLSNSRFLEKKDVKDEPRVTIEGYEIQDVSMETAPREDKYVLTFKEMDKPLVLNKTNGQLIAMALGTDEFDDWIGKQVVLFNDKTVSFQGKITGGIRVKPCPDAGSLPSDPDAY